jgi:hypothetical protein
MTSTRKVLLGSAAALVVVTGGASGSAQAADAAIKKAPPVQYVKICDKYGNGFYWVPGTNFCVQIGTNIQSDNYYITHKDVMFMTQSKGSGAYSPNIILANQQDTLSWQVSTNIKVDVRNDTSWGIMRSYVEFKATRNTAGFAGEPAGGEQDKGVQLFKGYVQWAGWTVGYNESKFTEGSYKQDDISSSTLDAKKSTWQWAYTWTPSGPGLPPKKGGAPVPDGWSFSVSAENPFAFLATSQAGGPPLMGLQGVAIPGLAAGSAAVARGPINYPDFAFVIHDEEDPPGGNGQNQPNFGLATLHFSAQLHNLTVIATGDGTLIAAPPAGCAILAGCAGNMSGVTGHDWGYGAIAGIRIFTPMAPNAKRGGLTQPDYIWVQAEYGNGALADAGVGIGQGNFGIGDTPGINLNGFLRDDQDAKWVNNGAGGVFADKEKAFSLNFSWHHILTDCTDPVYCFRMNLLAAAAWVQPGDITKNTDWTHGGLGNARQLALGANLIWGTRRPQSSGGVMGMGADLQAEVMYFKTWQDLPCNNNGNAAVPCGTPTAFPVGISKDPSNIEYRLTATRSF